MPDIPSFVPTNDGDFDWTADDGCPQFCVPKAARYVASSCMAL